MVYVNLFYFDAPQRAELYQKKRTYIINSLYTMALIFVEDPIVLWNYIFTKSVKHNNLL